MTDYARLRELAVQVRDDLGLAGPWRWAGNVDRRSPYITLCTRDHGRRFVMTFARVGMQGAQPRFPDKGADDNWVTMVDAIEVPVFEVAPDARSVDDRRVYRADITGFRNPVADYLAAVDADTVLGLLDRIAELEAQVNEPVAS